MNVDTPAFKETDITAALLMLRGGYSVTQAYIGYENSGGLESLNDFTKVVNEALAKQQAKQQPQPNLRASAPSASGEANAVAKHEPQANLTPANSEEELIAAELGIDPVTKEELMAAESGIVNDIAQWVACGVSAEEMEERLKEEVSYAQISDERIAELVAKHAPHAPAVRVVAENNLAALAPVEFQYPPELKPLVDAGLAVYSRERRGWTVKRCRVCNRLNRDECCGEKTIEVGATTIDGGSVKLTKYGRQATGLEAIPPPKTEAQKREDTREGWATTDWWKAFSGFDELEDGGLKMYIDNFLPEGITIISSLPKEGKTWLALSIAKALTTGRPLFGKKGFEVLEQAPVLYLAAEASDRALKHRAAKFGTLSTSRASYASTL